jgi:uncharacterized protein
MRLDDLDPSENARDLGRGGGGGGFGGGGGMGGGLIGILFSFLPMLLGRKLGCGTIAIIAVVGFFVMSSGMLNFGGMTGAPTEQAAGGSGGNVACDTAAEMESCKIVGSLEKTWAPLFAQAGARFTPATLNFFDQQNQSGCGVAQAAMGPFYCPADQGIYIDTSFFAQMEQMGAGGDFARAYVVAHEYGHHIQTLEGTSDQVRQAQGRASQAEGNAIQVRMELQADCYAGVWAARNPTLIEPGDLEEGMRAANAIGDDTLMRNAGQSVQQENFTHGTSEQRMTWLRRGAQTGDPTQCDTFSGRI